MADYKWLVLNQVVKRTADGASIPNDTANRDWQAFQTWLLIQGNVPDAADPPPSPAQILADFRLGAANFLDDAGPVSKAQRAFILVLIDEINVLRTRFNDLATDVAAATSLANLQNRWAAHPTLNNRDISQVKPAILAKITTGAAD